MKSIKDMPEHNRPRELLQKKGAVALSDEQLVMAILGSGGKKFDVVTLSNKIAGIIREHGKSLLLEHLISVPGIGLAKASQILSAFELARRYLLKPEIKISSVKHVLPLLADITTKKQEYFICLSLNGANELIEKRIITIGLVNSSQVHPREVFADVISDRATSVIFAHNHPSGTLTPSEADKKIQNQLTEAGKILGINILDHIIISRNGYFSFQEAGLID